MKKIITIGLLLLMSACVHTKVERVGRMEREIMVRPVLGSMSEARLVSRLLIKADERNCYSIKLIDISDGTATGLCYDIVH